MVEFGKPCKSYAGLDGNGGIGPSGIFDGTEDEALEPYGQREDTFYFGERDDELDEDDPEYEY